MQQAILFKWARRLLGAVLGAACVIFGSSRLEPGGGTAAAIFSSLPRQEIENGTLSDAPLSAVRSSASTDEAMLIDLAVPRAALFDMSGLPSDLQVLSRQLLLQALDGEALYTLTGTLKPVSEGFWGSYFSVDPPDLAEVERVRLALQAWHVPGLFYADVLIYESLQSQRRYASAYVVHVPSLQRVIRTHAEFFGKLGITPDTPPQEVLLIVERTRQPDDRWRGFGRLFGYPEHAVDFFVSAGMHQRETGEFIERDFRNFPTFSSNTGRFVYAVPQLSRLSEEEKLLERQTYQILTEYRRLRSASQNPESSSIELLREWMDDGQGNCHPKHLLAKLPTRTDAEWDEAIAKQRSTRMPPPVLFHHLYVVLDQETFDAARDSALFTNALAATDQGYPKHLPIDDDAKAIYLRGRDTYIECLSPNNAYGEPPGRIGIGWNVEPVGGLDRIEQRLKDRRPTAYSRASKQWDFEQDMPIDWYQAIFRNDFPAPHTIWWFSEFDAGFLPAMTGTRPTSLDRVKRSDFLASQFDASKWVKNFHNAHFQMPSDVAKALRLDLETVGWRVTEFDDRTWILQGDDFRLLLQLSDTFPSTRLRSIGFSMNEPNTTSREETISPKMRIKINEKGTGWLEFQD